MKINGNEFMIESIDRATELINAAIDELSEAKIRHDSYTVTKSVSIVKVPIGNAISKYYTAYKIISPYVSLIPSVFITEGDSFSLPDDIDPAVIPMVNYFNANGLPTAMSCQGHNHTNMSMFWIEFKDDVSEDDILEFQKKHLNDAGDFAACGNFANRVYLRYDDATGNFYPINAWRYMAATKQAAGLDLKLWKIDDIKREIEYGLAVIKKLDIKKSYYEKMFTGDDVSKMEEKRLSFGIDISKAIQSIQKLREIISVVKNLPKFKSDNKVIILASRFIHLDKEIESFDELDYFDSDKFQGIKHELRGILSDARKIIMDIPNLNSKLRYAITNEASHYARVVKFSDDRSRLTPALNFISNVVFSIITDTQL